MQSPRESCIILTRSSADFGYHAALLIRLRKNLLLLFSLLGYFIPAAAQTDWSALPFIAVGDSAAIRQEKVMVTGMVRDSNGAPLTAASVSFDLMKYFDYTDLQEIGRAHV